MTSNILSYINMDLKDMHWAFDQKPKGDQHYDYVKCFNVIHGPHANNLNVIYMVDDRHEIMGH